MKISFAIVAIATWSLVAAVTWANPPGDECSTAIVVPSTSLPYNKVINNTMYSYNVLDSIDTCNIGNKGKTIFFKFTPNIDGLLIIDTRESVSLSGIAIDNVVSVLK